MLEKPDMTKTICKRSEHVKILANQSGWPGAAEDALSYANPTTSEICLIESRLLHLRVTENPDSANSSRKEPAEHRRECNLPRRRQNKANPKFVHPKTLKKSPIGRESKGVAIQRLETSPTCVSWSDLRRPQTSAVVQARVSTGQIPRAIGGPGFEREKHVAPEPDG